MLGNSTVEFERCLIDFGIVILIWLVQLIIYPSLQYVRAEAFQAWHYTYTGLIALFVCPLMFGQVGLYGYLCWQEARWHDFVGLGLISIAWVATFTLSVPCHDKLQKRGYDIVVIRRLVATNWIRTVVWSVLFVLGYIFADENRSSLAQLLFP